jgi:hypothetical protein
VGTRAFTRVIYWNIPYTLDFRCKHAVGIDHKVQKSKVAAYIVATEEVHTKLSRTLSSGNENHETAFKVLNGVLAGILFKETREGEMKMVLR